MHIRKGCGRRGTDCDIRNAWELAFVASIIFGLLGFILGFIVRSMLPW